MNQNTRLNVLRQRPVLTAAAVFSAAGRPGCGGSGEGGPARSLYIHVPFCFHKCHYCDFYSIVDTRDRQEAFVARLERELAALAAYAGGVPLKTIFVGGGTPSLLPLERARDRSDRARAVAELQNRRAGVVEEDDAFRKARLENKPIFLSIGYSTCHWCHVMAHESFENADVAAVLNASFVPIKVDREERPDVDRVYMTFVQATTGSGGWPMSVWLTPDLKPFYGGTYFPPSSRWGRPGFVDILGEIARVWQSEQAKVQQSAESLTTQLRGVGRGTPPTAGVPGVAALDRIASEFRNLFDQVHGGFGGAPKFPRPSELLFLFRYWALKNLKNPSNPSNPSNPPNPPNPATPPEPCERSERHGPGDASRHGLRGNARSHRRRIPSLLG